MLLPRRATFAPCIQHAVYISFRGFQQRHIFIYSSDVCFSTKASLIVTLRKSIQSRYTALERPKMAYTISFAGGVEEAFETLDTEAASKVEKKLERVANDEWRTPYDWGYSAWTGQAGGKFNWGAYRVFADIDTDTNQIIVHEARHRENLYR